MSLAYVLTEFKKHYNELTIVLNIAINCEKQVIGTARGETKAF